MKKKRLIGITVVSTIDIILALLIVLNSRPLSIKYGDVLLIITSIGLIFGNVGVLLSKDWGRKVLLTAICVFTILILHFLYWVYKIAGGIDWHVLIVHLIILIANIVLLFLLTRPKVKEQFK